MTQTDANSIHRPFRVRALLGYYLALRNETTHFNGLMTDNALSSSR
jgi:hypothetical protein